MFTFKMLTGQSTEHLSNLYGDHRLHNQTIASFIELQYVAKKAGFNLQPVSTFRHFSRQQRIWNDKFTGSRTVLDINGQPLDITTMNNEKLCKAILVWSAMPGASRHHWGTEIDVYDPDLLPKGQKLRLELWEYLKGGYQYPLQQWLACNMIQFGFYCPFGHQQQDIAIEPWHISYKPISSLLENQLTEEALKQSWQGQYIAGSQWLIHNIKEIFFRFIIKNYNI
ncbi:M15 family metallopeptidase [Candidatus Profftia sp. (ex Adelges kitamiensis)]|uniref:M15 family metallopeptidase n=1 Tax=Candidatus Profftia sp. (ex Adelges kitamiensis) TaxID=2864218 RepID=UPI001CE25E2E|nr:M15 family metallopeptidase [Candidatus Profftia sp. (ex Adelges kitamiensis)]